MKCTIRSLACCAVLSVVLLCSCVHNDTQSEEAPATTADLIAKAAADPTPPKPMQLPVRYQTPAFVTVNDNRMDDELAADQEYTIKVGADIRSITGPQPLWDIMKRLAGLKGMSVSWASDVDQQVKVDIDISANDDYFKAINNLLRQVDYFHEVKDSTIIVKYKETKTYHVAIPFTQQVYTTAIGGNVLGTGGSDTTSSEGTIHLDSNGDDFDIWQNIRDNLDAIIATWSTSELVPEAQPPAAATDAEQTETSSPTVTRQVSARGNTYTIDKPVGLITVNAPRPLQKKINDYLTNLKRELYKQVIIEAKIIEVQLDDNSTLGIDWNLLLRSLSFGGGGMSFNQNYSRDNINNLNNSDGSQRGITNSLTNSNALVTNNTSTDGTTNETATSQNSSSDTTTDTSSSAIGAATTAATIITGGAANAASATFSLATFNFADFLHALSTQGNTSILSNPKLSVMNGQPALISAGKSVSYISEVTANTEGLSGVTTYTPRTASILSGVGLAITPVIRNDGTIIMNIVPVTSVLEEPIVTYAVSGGNIGLPVVNIREMSTTVQVKDGEMLVIGGLITTVESTSGENLFPGLADVPILKYLTGYETKVMQKRELIILLRPRIL